MDLGEAAARASSTFSSLPFFPAYSSGQFTPPANFGQSFAGFPNFSSAPSFFPSFSNSFPTLPTYGSSGNVFQQLAAKSAQEHALLDAKTKATIANTPVATQTGTDSSGPYDPADVEAYIRNKAASLRIDPDIAFRVANSEGLHTYVGDNNTSFGPFQLHYNQNGEGGQGDAFTAQTGLDARDQTTWKPQVDWVLNGLAAGKFDWTPWHGATAQGIVGKMGLGTYTGTVPDYVPKTTVKTPAILTAEKIMADTSGVPYHFGGVDPATGTDCSGYVAAVFQKAYGIQLPHNTQAMVNSGMMDPVANPQPGDLVFFNMEYNNPNLQHVGIYLGGGQMINDTDYGGKSGVQHADISQGSWWWNQHPQFYRVRGT